MNHRTFRTRILGPLAGPMLASLITPCLSPQAEAQQFVNGGFEFMELYDSASPHFGPSAPGKWYNIPAGSPALTGWRVSYGSIDVVVPSYWQPASGVGSLDANGWVRGGIEQDVTFATTTECYLEFMFAKNGYLNLPARLGVWYKSPAAAEFQGLGEYIYADDNSPSDMKWAFVGTSALTLDAGTYTFAFGSIAPAANAAGPALDSIVLRTGPSPYLTAPDPGPYPPTGLEPNPEPNIPEPAQYTIASALGLLAFLVLRRSYTR